jgi:Fe-S oxidoreductase
MSLDSVREWLYGCTHCGTCKDVLNIFIPDCPAGERFQLESFFPSGQVFLARGVTEGVIDLADDETRARVYACTGCLACEQQCGVFHHNHIFEIVRAVRAEAVTKGLLNPAYMVMIDSLKRDDNVFGRPKAERGDWAKGLDVRLEAQERTDVLYHVGCMMSFEPELWNVPKSVLKIMKAAGIDAGIMGREEACCGGRAFETGYLGEFTKYAEHFMETCNSLGVKTVVTSCSDGYATFRNLYPDVGVKTGYDVLHTVELLDRLLKEGKLA